MDVSVIIVNYNTKDLLDNCLKSLYKHTKDLEFEIIVVDNASTDYSQEFIKSSFPDVILIESETNLGFGKANNLGAQYAKGEFLFILNSDTILLENSINTLFEFYKKNSYDLNIGVIGALMIDENFKINGFGSEFPNCRSEIRNILSTLPVIKKIVPPKSNKNYPIQDAFFEIDYVLGADMFVSADIFNRFKGFSNDFFMYYEESDLQKRIRDSGLKNYIISTTKIIHLEDGSGKKINNYSNTKRIIVHESKNIYLKKNDFKKFHFYKIIDFSFLLLNLINYKYSFKENRNYFSKIIKTY